MSESWMTSIGLDIGTSTTKFIVSQLLIAERGQSFSLPSCQIIDRRVTYTSKIYTTPLKNNFEIDMERLAALFEEEYRQSHTRLIDVKAGAVIITGETAGKQNAETIIHFLADRAGDFVVATAGASLEGVLAGKGSGAMQHSEKVEGVIANIDIGGGTANVALFQEGRAIQTFTFHIGGRLIRLSKDGVIEYVSKQIEEWLRANQYFIKVGDQLAVEQLKDICLKMSESMISYMNSSPKYHGNLLLLDQLVQPMPPIVEIIFSGGVGQMMLDQNPEQMEEVTIYGDIGPMLAKTLFIVTNQYPIARKKAIETTRATVIGAGMQNTEVSGATVFVNQAILPIKNIPIVKLAVEEQGYWEKDSFTARLIHVFQEAGKIFEFTDDPPFALALTDIQYCTYDMLQEMSSAISRQYVTQFPHTRRLIVVCENDMAKALGQALTKNDNTSLQIICIDQVDFTYGDYIDLGLPVAGEAISISIKTLAF